MKAAGLISALALAASVHAVVLPASDPVEIEIETETADVEASGRRGLAFKPFSDLAVQINPVWLSPGRPVLVDLDSRDDARATSVSLSSTGGVRIDEKPAEVVFDGPTAATVGQVSSIIGEGSLTAVITGRDSAGLPISASDTVWVDIVGGDVVISEIGTQDLALRVADARESAGDLSADEADNMRDVAVSGSSLAPALVVERAAAATCGPGLVCVAGTAQWTDSVGGLHPIAGADLEIMEANAGTDDLIAALRTGDDGSFSASFDNVDPEGGARDIYVRLLASGDGFSIVMSGSLATQRVESPVQSDVPDGSLAVPIVTNNVDDNHTAFSLHNAMAIGHEYLLTVEPIPFPDIQVVFPAGGSFYNGLRLNMLRLDRWDWDVMIHEYGHFVADELNIERNPGGPHSGQDNLADDVGRDKDEGVRLAWGEGWATYFAVSSLQEADAVSLGIPNIGDTSYQDTEDIVITNDLETGSTIGEDNEVTVMGVLWDLYDDVVDGADEIALGDVAVWDVLDAVDPETLSDAYGAFAPNGGAAYDTVNCVFSQLNVAPRLAGAASTVIAAPSTSPTFAWSPGNGGIIGENDVFEVEYRNSANNLLLHTSGPITSTTYSALQAQWNAAVAGAGGVVNVTVAGTEILDAGEAPFIDAEDSIPTPDTGPYRSCARQFVGGPPAPPALFTSIEPRRFVDTRPNGETLDGDWEADGPRSGGSDAYVIDFAGRGDVPDGARAVVANLTAVQAADVGFVTAFDCSLPRPLASSLNYTSGVNLGNEVIVTLNAAGEACLFTSADTHLTVDVVGYVAADSSYQPVDPARLLETRTNGQQTIDRTFEADGSTSAGGQTRVAVADRGGVPDNASAAVVNVTAIGAEQGGFVTVHPCLDVLPLAASLNYVSGVNRGNELIVPLDGDGDICLFTSTSVHLTVDVVGYVSPPSNLQSTTPARFLDTRGAGATIDGSDQRNGKRPAGSQYTLQITGRNGVPAALDAVIINVTAVRPEGTGFVTVHPCEAALPTASSVNHVDGVTGGNEIIAKLDGQGRVCLFTSNSTHLTVDVAGYLAL